MDERILSMTGYEFENYISTLLINMGFEVEATQYSNDGGIDLIATYDKPIFAGKYIIQCKRWATSVGQPEVRDLYGVVMDQRANKGILITTSDFTSQAYSFAQGKNIELINGEVLRNLIDSSKGIYKIEKTSSQYNYRNDRYLYLKKCIEEEPSVDLNYVNMLNYLREIVRKQDDSLCCIELFDEIIQWADKMINKFFRSQSKLDDKKVVQLIQVEAYLHSGRLSEALEILLKNNMFWIFDVNGLCYYHGDICTGGSNYRIMAWNLYSAFKHINYNKGCKLIFSKIKSINGRFADMFYTENKVLGVKFLYPEFRFVHLSGQKRHLEFNEFKLSDVREPAYFYDNFYVISEEEHAKQLDKVFELHGII